MKRLILAALVVMSLQPVASAKRFGMCDVQPFDSVIVRARFVSDDGCIVRAITVDGVEYTDLKAATPKALASLGWATADAAKRTELAVAWVDEVLTLTRRFRVVTDDRKLGKKFFARTTRVKDGGVILRFWRDDTRIGAQEPTQSTYIDTVVKIDRRGVVTVDNRETVRLPFRD